METYQENIPNGLEGNNLSKITKIYFHCTSSNETSKITQIRHSLKMPLDSCIRVLVKLCNFFGYKILAGFCFRSVNRLREFLKKRGRRHIQDLAKRLGWTIFIKIKTTWTKVLQERSMLDVWKDPWHETNYLYRSLPSRKLCKSNAYPTLIKPCFGTF